MGFASRFASPFASRFASRFARSDLYPWSDFMSDWVLEFHGYRENPPTDESEIVALFCFSLMDAAERRSGKRPDHTKTFWTETSLSRDLGARGRWASLSKRDKLKAMYLHARSSIVESGRRVRQAPLFWTATSPLREGPPWDLSRATFPKPSVEVFSLAQEPAASFGDARKAAGLLS